jgi:hypothetical protein
MDAFVTMVTSADGVALFPYATLGEVQGFVYHRGHLAAVVIPLNLAYNVLH